MWGCAGVSFILARTNLSLSLAKRVSLVLQLTQRPLYPHSRTDSQGRVVNFKNTIIILTSNLGAEHLQKAALDSSTGKRVSQVNFLLFLALALFFWASVCGHVL